MKNNIDMHNIRCLKDLRAARKNSRLRTKHIEKLISGQLLNTRQALSTISLDLPAIAKNNIVPLAITGAAAAANYYQPRSPAAASFMEQMKVKFGPLLISWFFKFILGKLNKKM